MKEQVSDVNSRFGSLRAPELLPLSVETDTSGSVEGSYSSLGNKHTYLRDEQGKARSISRTAYEEQFSPSPEASVIEQETAQLLKDLDDINARAAQYGMRLDFQRLEARQEEPPAPGDDPEDAPEASVMSPQQIAQKRIEIGKRYRELGRGKSPLEVGDMSDEEVAAHVLSLTPEEISKKRSLIVKDGNNPLDVGNMSEEEVEAYQFDAADTFGSSEEKKTQQQASVIARNAGPKAGAAVRVKRSNDKFEEGWQVGRRFVDDQGVDRVTVFREINNGTVIEKNVRQAELESWQNQLDDQGDQISSGNDNEAAAGSLNDLAIPTDGLDRVIAEAEKEKASRGWLARARKKISDTYWALLGDANDIKMDAEDKVAELREADATADENEKRSWKRKAAVVGIGVVAAGAAIYGAWKGIEWAQNSGEVLPKQLAEGLPDVPGNNASDINEGISNLGESVGSGIEELHSDLRESLAESSESQPGNGLWENDDLEAANGDGVGDGDDTGEADQTSEFDVPSLESYAKQFDIPRGSGGEALLERLKVDRLEWYQFEDRLLKEFPNEFYRMDDGHVGLQNPGLLSEKAQVFILDKVGLPH